MHRTRKFIIGLTALLAVISAGSATTTKSKPGKSQPQTQRRRIDSWLDYSFDADAPIGSEKNPAVILPSDIPKTFSDIPGAKQIGDVILVSAAGFQSAARQPLMGALFASTLGRTGNVKSFDGFSAVDMTGLIANLPSEIMEAPDTSARSITRENPDTTRRLLRDGDIVFGSHVINYMSWGRYNHVAIVIDAARGVLAESTAHLPTDQPGVRLIDWKTFVSGYVHVGVVRVKGASTGVLSRLIRWLQDRRGRPYRWPIIQGLDKADQSRFYCSQLVWLAFKDVMNLDLDVDKGVLVFPDDIYYSKDYVDVIVP